MSSFYALNVEYDYNLQGTLDARGSNNGQRSSGALSSMTSVASIQAVQQNSDGSYIFVMNMFGTQVNVGQGSSLEDMAERSLGDDEDDGLGADMYYQQSANGEITQVWYQEGDSPYFVEVKLGAINSFHTHTLDINQGATVLESTAAGVHYSAYSGSGTPSLVTMNKAFTQSSFQSFSDPNVKPSDVSISANAAAGVSSQGFIQSTSISQLVSVKDAGATTSDNNNGLMDMTLSSYGTLSLQFAQSALGAEKKRFKTWMNGDDLKNGTRSYKGSTTHNLAIQLIKKRAERKPRIELDSAIVAALATPGDAAVKKLNQIIRFCRASNNDVIPIIEKYFQDAQFESDAEYRKKLIYIAASIPTGDYLLLTYGLNSNDRATHIATIMASHSIVDPSAAYIMQMEELAFGSSKKFHKTRPLAILAYGTLIGKIGQSGKKLITELHASTHIKRTISILNAIGNAGPSSIAPQEFPAKFINHPNASIRRTLARSLRKYAADASILPLAASLLLDADADVRRESRKIFANLPKLQLENSDLPFNKSWTGSYTLGGSQLSAAFQAQVLLGTNFDCNQQYFNYEAMAEATATLSLLGDSKQAFDAEFVYGKINGGALQDEIFLQVWNDVIVDQKIPGVDCATHSYPIGTFNQGIDVTYTLWVSVIPVVFTVTGSLNLDLSWNWQICDASLSAQVELVPTATFMLDGNAEVDLLIILAGINLQGSLNSQIIPQAYIHGTQCEIGMDIQQVSTPMSVELDSYYAWDSCKYWIFDCHWGQHNTQVWASWNQPAIDKVMYNVDWKIAP
eukprot:TRINITY_DN2_c0_g1_i1.p1 TRINITY_DN2_c0_g1~~TRINITY_DN2_c0_g1_i1.p1  ORF type:complete len:795 (+),score=281.42 TRINITY_DN2_c0_g1_i1:2379-4763(+)